MIPVAKCETLIRRPVAQIFEAFIDPAITCHFWYSKGSGRLEPGKTAALGLGDVRWWEPTSPSKRSTVNRRILIAWNGPENPSDVRMDI